MLKKTTFIISLLFLLSACSASKKAAKSIASGDYDKAFDIAILKLNKDKYKKSNQKLIPSLKIAFEKANERDLKQIGILRKVHNLSNLRRIYALYSGIDVRQDDVIALLPLSFENKEIKFKITDYSKKIKTSLNTYSEELFSVAKQQLAGSKFDARDAYDNFNDLEFVNPSYEPNIVDFIQEAKMKGSSLVILKVNNHISTQTTPDLIDELTRISESNMNDEWVIYHNSKESGINYDYEVLINLDQVHISPEQVNSETIPQKATIKDGWEYVYDTNGNVAKDSLGNDIKRDKIISVSAEIKMFTQLKTARIDGKLVVKNLGSHAILNDIPMFGEAKFENNFALYHGDQRAIEKKYYKALQSKEAPFPNDSDFVKYSVAEFRIKMLKVLNEQDF